jgi:hypothetical protein
MTQAKEILRKYSHGIVRNDTTEENDILAAMQEHTDLKTKELQLEMQQLKERAEVLAKTLTKIVEWEIQFRRSDSHTYKLANEALASWKEDQPAKPALRSLDTMTIEEWISVRDQFSLDVYDSVENKRIKWKDKPKHVLVLENRLQTNTLLFNDGLLLMKMGFDLQTNNTEDNG